MSTLNVDLLVGQKKAEAVKSVESMGFIHRIRKDGDRVDASRRPNRVNLWIKGGVVSKASIG